MVYQKCNRPVVSYSGIKAKAEEFGIPLDKAIEMRKKYVKTTIGNLNEQLDAEQSFAETADDELEFRFAIESMTKIIKSIKQHERLLDFNRPELDLTNEDVESARSYPIDQVIEFHRGKSLAFCHPDKTPSLSWDKKNNRAHCFPCGKSFNALDVLIERDGLSFIEAVKQLR